MTPQSIFISVLLVAVATHEATGFALTNLPQTRTSFLTFAKMDENLGDEASVANPELFEDEEEMWPIAESFVHAKYKECAQLHGHKFCTQEDIRDSLRSLLPPVTPKELEEEVEKTMAIIMQNKENKPDRINEDCFVKAIVKNTYWQTAGSLLVKELMYFDALYHYYKTGTPLLSNDDYEELKDNLVWEGSSVPSMSKQEAMFINAVASSKRGEPILSDEEYQSLKEELKGKGSWVTDRKQDALEKLGLNTFLGYLHRSLD